MIFLIGGYDNNEPYGRVYEFAIPSKPDPLERCAGGDFGGVWGGQRDIVDRLLNGIDPGLTAALKDALKLSDTESRKLVETIGPRLSLPIPYAFLPLQDCVDMVTLLIRTTINVQKWMMGVRGVGGAIDVATITRTRGFEPVQIKAIRGESRNG